MYVPLSAEQFNEFVDIIRDATTAMWETNETEAQALIERLVAVTKPFEAVMDDWHLPT